MNEVAVVILNYNGASLLPVFLPSVVAHSPSASLYVIDNHSTDKSVAYVRENFPSIQVIQLAANLGYCGGYNAGLKQIEAKYYVLLNSDIEVTPRWIDPVLDLFRADNRLAAAQPKIRSYRNRQFFEYAGAAGGFVDIMGYPLCRGRVVNAIEKDEGQYDDSREVFWATGACLFIRSDVFHQLGGFDEDFFAHMEEIDLCWRIHRLGLKVYYVGESMVYHLGGGTLSESHPMKTFLNFRNGLVLLIKNLPVGKLWYKLPIRIGMDWLAAVVFLFIGHARMAWAVLRAHAAVLRRWSGTWAKRKSIQGAGDITGINLFPHSIVINYFLLGRRKFSELVKK